MAGTTISIKGVLVELPTQILTNIDGDPTREYLIKLYQLISGNAASGLSSLGGGRHGHLTLTMTVDDYIAQRGYAFVPPHNP